MIPLKSHYPEFVPNQILTNTQLNQLRDHLDQQDQRTRVRLVGTGIVCGLTWSVDTATGHIDLDEGYGITSDGHLVEVGDTLYTHYREYRDPDVDAEGEPLYKPWLGPGKPVELLDAAAVAALAAAPVKPSDDPPAEVKDLVPTTGQGRILVLYLEQEPVRLKSCIVTDCNNTGVNVHLNVRALLVHLGETGGCADIPAPVRFFRPHVVGELGADGVDWGAVYTRAFQQAEFETTIPAAFRAWGAALDLDPGLPGELEALLVTLKAATPIGQYHYDLLVDLADALNEAVAAACEVIAPCCPESRFPRRGTNEEFARHLMLGAFNDAASWVADFRLAGYRHVFLPAPARNVAHGELERVRLLFRRLAEMVRAFDPTAPNAVRITPSQGQDRPLGTRALPFYYADTAELRGTWQPRLCCTTDLLWSYHHRAEPNDLEADDLAFDYNRCSFVRIEGHLGLGGSEALNRITELRRENNASFDVCRAELGEDVFEAEDDLRGLLRSALDEWDTAAAEFAARILEAVREGSLDPDQVLEAARVIAEHGTEISVALDRWTGRRCARELKCDITFLCTDYATARGELLGVLHRLRGELAKPPSLGAEPGDVSVDGVKQMIAERLAAELAVVPEIDERLENQVRATAELIAGNPDATVAVDHLRVLAAEALSYSIDDLLRLLPGNLCRLSWGSFSRKYKRFAADLVYYWLLWKARELPGGFTFLGHEDPAEWPLLVLGNRGYATLATLFFTYEEIRRGDLGVFSNLVSKIDGLGHLAGVEKGGTFVLACDGGNVVGDFSLPGRLPCCCEVDIDAICLPPAALPDHRVALLREQPDGTYRPVNLWIDVLADDYDPNAEQRQVETFEVTLETEEVADEEPALVTPFGARVRVENGQLRYRLEDPPPGVVDRFSYTLTVRGERCRGRDTGDVLVLLLAPEPETGEVRGLVTEADGVTAVEGAEVRLVEAGVRDTTTAQGVYHFADRVPGEDTLEVTHVDFEPAAEPVTVVAGTTAHVDFALDPRFQRGDVVLRVRDAQTSAAIAGALVRLVDGTGTVQVDGTTDGNGQVEFLGVVEGVYQAQAEADGYDAAALPNVVVEKDTPFSDQIALTLTTGAITGTVTTADGVTPVEGAQVVLVGTTDQHTTTATGFYDFSNVPPGVHDVEVTHADFETLAQSVAVVAEATAELDFALSPRVGDASFTVLDAVTGAAIFEASVRLVDENGTTRAGGTTNDAGLVELLGVVAGTYQAEANADGYDDAVLPDVVVEEGTPFSGEILMTLATGAADVSVVDREGGVVPGLQVELRAVDDSLSRTAATESDGVAHFPDVPPGFYKALVLSAENTPLGGSRGEVVADAVAEITVVLGGFFLFEKPTDNFVAMVSETLDLSLEQARGRIGDVYSGRYKARLEAMSAAAPVVGTSKRYTSAEVFLNSTLIDPESSETDVLIASLTVLTSLVSAILRVADPDRKNAFKDVLVQVNLASMDRLSFFQPQELDPEVEPHLAEMSRLTREAEIPIDRVVADWDGGSLTTDLGVKSAADIVAKFGGQIG